jgi:hypothetical protein
VTDHGYTVDDVALLPEDFRYELIDGELAFPRGVVVEEQIRAELAMMLERQSPADLTARYRISYRTYWSDRGVKPLPDVTVTRRDHAEPDFRALERVLLGIDVLEASHGFVEMLNKVEWYAAAGVAHLWIVEPTPRGEVGLTRYRLGAGGRYEELGHTTAVVDVEEPFPMFFDLTELCFQRCRS